MTNTAPITLYMETSRGAPRPDAPAAPTFASDGVMTPPTGWVVARPERDDNKIIWVSVCQYDYDTGGASDGSEPQPDKKPTPAHPRVTKTRNVLTKLRELMTQRLTQQGEIESYVIGGREVRTMTVREHAALIRDYEGRLDTALLSATGRPYRLH